MLEKPDIEDQSIIDFLGDVYGLSVIQVAFIPIGDISSAKYRVITTDQAAYFLKLTKEYFEETSVAVPHFLAEKRISQVIPAQKTKDGRLWTHLDAYTCVLYPFVEGQNGFRKQLTDHQWREFGAALRAIHSLRLPPALQSQIPIDSYSPTWQEKVLGIMEQVESITFDDPVSAQLAAVLQAHRDEIQHIIARAASLGNALRSHSPERVLCHSDIHAANLLLDGSDAVYIIDWDNPILAPKERDLMFIGGGVGGIWNTHREEALFYQGYGMQPVNPDALIYYRYERIVEDIAAFSQQILPAAGVSAERERSLQKFNSIFYPHQVLAIAFQTDQSLGTGR